MISDMMRAIGISGMSLSAKKERASVNLIQRAFHLAHFIFPKGGTCLEFGVFEGGTYSYQASEIMRQYPYSSLVGFDSWHGLPEEAAGVWFPKRHEKGGYSAQKTKVIQKLQAIGVSVNDQRFRFVDGFYSESLTDHLRDEISNVIFINIDVDIYRSTIEVLEFIRPLLRPGVIIYWDDWKDPKDEGAQAWGEHLAWENWFTKQQDFTVETLEVNPVNQRTMIVVAVDGQRMMAPLPTICDIRYHAQELADFVTHSPLEIDPDYQSFLRWKTRCRKFPLSRAMARIIRAMTK